MDSYEESFDEYVEFMKKYQDSDDPTGMMIDLADYMTRTVCQQQIWHTTPRSTPEYLRYSQKFHNQ